MNERERVEGVLERIRPLLQADGGDMELIDASGRKATVRLRGKCATCPSAYLTLHVGVESVLKEELPDFEELIVVNP